MRRFMRKSTVQREPLAVTMTGVRMGERVLQIGLGDPRLMTMLAAKPGLSGQAALLVSEERSGDRARAAAAESGLLIDVHVAPPAALPFEDRVFDAVIVHDAAPMLAAMEAGARARAVSEWRRVLRPGGRIVTLEPGTRVGLSGLLHRAPAPDPAYDSAGGTAAALQAGDFRGVRLLADREGVRYFEGVRP